MARPTKAPEERRTTSLPPVRVTEAEMAIVHAQAQAARLSVSDFLRQRAVVGTVTPRPTAGSDRLLVELNRAGVNLNQIARHLNSGGSVPSDLGHVLHQLYTVLEKVGRSYGA
ncbi:MobC family plasmid mobilization relaxosome protein [Sinorhizobium medicae]|uniref:MobC family plasmid mobilization relaxosome protein n=1 Tax=Sinorhizobium medicae TaxID=110321 RepID=UPI000C7B4059|nr:MobC family plasmid mobilization relaxosome protein [Sinorhizobium medicae]PLU25733.1 hypothetical protein BMJ28_33515 [Sinorhizobium medicae]